MRRAVIALLRNDPKFAHPELIYGLEKRRFKVVDRPVMDLTRDDVLVVWNRQSRTAALCAAAERAEARIIVIENGYFGREWRGGRWYALSLEHHYTTPIRHLPERWPLFGVDLKPWQPVQVNRVLLLPQRGIGEPGIGMPQGWAQKAWRYFDERGWATDERGHPGAVGQTAADDLEDAIRGYYAVATWASSAGIKALVEGVPVINWYPDWLMRAGCVPFDRWDGGTRPKTDRLPAFERMAGGLWSAAEIASGEPFDEL
jgi:hypothetical protein